MFQEFPYTDMHQLNMDWIIKIAKDFLDQYTHIQQLIEDGEQSLQDLTEEGLQQLDEKEEALEALLDAWYTEHSEDIAGELADAIRDLNDWYTSHSADISDELASAISSFNTAATNKSQELLDSWPDDYSELVSEYNYLKKGMIDHASEDYSYLANIDGKYVKTADGTEGTSTIIRCSDYVEFKRDTYKIETYAKTGAISINPLVCFYDASKTFLFAIGQSASYVTVTDGNAVINLTATGVPETVFTAKYIRFNVSNQAADQDYVHFRILKNNIGSIAGGGIADSTKSVHNLPANSIAWKYTSGNDPLYAPYTGWMGNMITVYGSNDPSPSGRVGMGILALGHGNRIHFCDKWSGNTWSKWTEFAKDTLTGESYTGTFESARQSLQTNIILEANTSYIVRMNTPVTGTINVFGLGNTDDYASVSEYKPECVFRNDGTRRYLVMFNIGETLDSVNVSVIPLRSYLKPVDIYYVSQTDSNADYSSVTACFLDLKNNAKEKIIYIDGGNYNIYQEYVDANVPVYTGDHASTEYFPYCVWVPPNTHVIGQGLVRLIWSPDAGDVTKPQADTVSTLNAAGSCIIENIEVHCKNGRYCLHNDSLGKAAFNGARQLYKNVRFYKYTNDHDGDDQVLGYTHTIGFGIDRQQHHEYVNCYFWNESTGRAFYGHTRPTVGGVTLTEAMSSDITLTDCVAETAGSTCVKLGNVNNSNLHVNVRFSSCFFNDRILVTDESEGAGNPNAFDITMLNCGNVDLVVTDPNNVYTPKLFNTNNN